MKKHAFRITIVMLVLSLFLSPTFSVGQTKKQVGYPEGYRQWAHVKSMVIEKGHPLYESFGGIHHVYANKAALAAMKDTKPFPDGAVIVFDLLEAKSESNAVTEGQRKFIGVMEKNAKMFNDTAGWGFEAFRGDGKERLVKDPKNECFNCHEAQKKSDYVFSTYRK
jgi:hypothetical protein